MCHAVLDDVVAMFRKRDSDISDEEKGHCITFKGISVGLYRENTPESASENIREYAAMGHPMSAEAIMAEYREKRLISECHGKARRYPAIKKWFLKQYPEVEKFGLEECDEEAATETGSKYEAVMAPLVKSNMVEEYDLAG